MNLISEQIQLPAIYTVPDSVIRKRDQMLQITSELAAVTDPSQQAVAVADGRTLQAHIKEVQETRVALSRPLDEAKAKLIQVERDYLAPLIAERDRLARLVTAFQVQEQDRVIAAERARQDEIERLETERKAAQALLAEARGNQEIAGAAQALQEATDAQRAVIVAPLPEVTTAKGAATRTVMRWAVTDLAALYQARPDLCRIEAKASAINALVTPNMTVPGLRVWEERETNFRRMT